MAPKAKAAKGKAQAIKIKQEPPCVKGAPQGGTLSATALANASFPQAIRDFYNGSLKYKKGDSATKKKEFIEKLLSGQGMTNPYFQIHESTEQTTSAWFSWKSLVAVESEQVIKLSLLQGKIIARPSERLDHTHPRTAELPEHETKENMYVSKQDIEKTITENSVSRSSDATPTHAADPRAEMLDNLNKLLTKNIKQWHLQRDDLNMRLDRFGKNPYPGFE